MVKKTVTSKKKTVKDQIEKRISQAVSRKIYEKARRVAYYLGNGPVCPDHPSTRRTYRNPNTELTIKLTCKAVDRSTIETLEILDGEKTVFLWKKESFFQYSGRNVSLQQDKAIEGYIPGDWEVELDKLQRPSNKAKKNAERADEKRGLIWERKRTASLRKPWGLL